MRIVGQTKKFVTARILPVVKPKQQALFAFGIQALSLTAYDSLGSNARMIIANEHTAHSNIYRLVRHKTLIQNFFRLFRESKLVTPTSIVNVDFSTFCGFETLAFGVQTGNGRALPV